MPSAEENVYSELVGFAGLQALVANTDSPVTYKIYPAEQPHDTTMPSVVYARTFGTREVLLSDGGGTGVERVSFRFTAWSKTALEAASVAEQIRLALAAATFHTVVELSRTAFDPDTKLHSFIYDIAVWHR